jgi:phosphate transport system substrate-binding protein
MFMRISQRLLLFLFCGLLLAGCSRSHKAIQIKGSDTMVNLAQAWVEEYMGEKPELAIAVTGGGSGTGIAAIISGTTDIALASREMKKKEIKMAEDRGVFPKEHHVASDGIVVAVHPSNPLNKITVQQLSDIFTGQVKNWRQLGGPNRRIVALSRERNSGTHVFFLEEIVKLGKKGNQNEFHPTILMMPSSQAIIEEIDSNPAAIGYIGLGYLTAKEKALAVGRTTAGPYVLPNVKTVRSSAYPISRSMHFYTNGTPSGEVADFIKYVFSPAGQRMVLKMDFVPVK